MARFTAFLMVLLFSTYCMAQKMELKELTSLLDVPINKLDNVLQKKGFRKDPFLTASESASLSFVRNNKENTFTQFLWLNPDKAYVYETTRAAEFEELRNEIKNAGFYSPKDDSSNKQSLVYQKQVFTIETDSRVDDSTQYFVLKLTRKDLPKRRDIVFAEDLLQLDSYEYLSEMFGKEQVKNDYFFYAEDDSSRCSIIFPNTNREAIIIWKDEAHLRNINFILIGGSLRSANMAANVQAFNGWRSRQGPYCGMTLKELEMLNQAPVKFYNWHTESPGCLVPKNKGSLDFERISMILNCMNCGFIKVSENSVIDSYVATEEMQKVYITSLLILPEKK